MCGTRCHGEHRPGLGGHLHSRAYAQESVDHDVFAGVQSGLHDAQTIDHSADDDWPILDRAVGFQDEDKLSILVGPDRLILSGALTPVSGSCQVYTVTSKDGAGNDTNVLANTQVNLTDAASAGVFYAIGDNTCAGAPIPNVTILSGNNNN